MPGKVGHNPLDMASVNRVYKGGNDEPLAVFVGTSRVACARVRILVAGMDG